MGGSLLNNPIPYTPAEGFVVLGGVFVLFLLVLIISYWKKLGIGKEFGLALVKGGVQLTIIALILAFLFTVDWWYFPIFILLGLMVVVSGFTSSKRAAAMPQAYRITIPAILLGSITAIIVLLVSRAMLLQPQFIIPLSGMVFGNTMNICSLSLDRLIRETKMNKGAIETMLSLGASPTQALNQYSTMSIKASLIPTIDSLKTLGIIFIPGAMAGLLIAGTDPLVAAEYQIIVYLMIVGGGIISSIMVNYFARKKIFTSAEQLEEWI